MSERYIYKSAASDLMRSLWSVKVCKRDEPHATGDEEKKLIKRWNELRKGQFQGLLTPAESISCLYHLLFIYL